MSSIRNYKKILVIKPSSLGDIVHSLPFLNSLRSGYPKAEIHWVVAKGFEGLLEGHPMIDRIIVINKDMWKHVSQAGKTVKEAGQLLKKLREEKYDLVIDLQGLLRSGVITMATRAPVRIGFAEAREGSRLFYNRKITGGEEVHAVDRYMKVAESLSCDTDSIIFPFPLMKNNLKETRDLIASLKEYCIIVPGARWKTKIWRADNFGKIASLLPLKSVVVGSRGDSAIAERVVEGSEGKAVSVAGKTNLRELIELMRNAKFVVSNDSGPMHIAAGFNVPVAAIFGPTSPVRTGPYGKGHVAITSTLDCSPCFRKSCKDLKCMDNISVDTVYTTIQGSFSL